MLHYILRAICQATEPVIEPATSASTPQAKLSQKGRFGSTATRLSIPLAIALAPTAAIAQVNIPVLPVPDAQAPTSSQNQLPTSAINNRSLTDATQGNIIDLPNVSTEAINQFNRQAYGDRNEAIVVPGSFPTTSEFGLRFTEQETVPTSLSPDASFSDRDRLTAVSCTYYDPNSSLLGDNAAITVTEFSENFKENTVFRYQQFSQIGATANSAPVVVAERTYILDNTPIAEARRELSNNREQYARFLGLSTDSALVRQGFGPIDRRLACRRTANDAIAFAPGESTLEYRELALESAILNAIALSTGATIREVEPFNSLLPSESVIPTAALSNLPDGNYRVISTNSSLSVNGQVVPNAESDRAFLFRKSGSSIVGNFTDQSDNASACVTGTIAGNTVTGSAYTRNNSAQVLGQSYLDAGLALQLGNFASNGRYDNSILSLSGFSPVNAGTVLPPTSCG